MDELLHIVESHEFPLLSAIILGLIVAISPCTVAANVTAVTFLTDKVNNKRKVFLRGLLYTLGRTVAYTVLGLVIFYFANGLKIGEILQHSIGKIIGPLFIIIGILMLDIIHIHSFADKCLYKMNFSFFKEHSWSSFFIGILLAFAFCPYSAAIYFGMLIPLSFSVSYGILLPFIFAVGSAIPVIVIVWLIAYSFSEFSNLYNKIRKYELWFRRILALLFIFSGVLFVIEYYFEQHVH